MGKRRLLFIFAGVVLTIIGGLIVAYVASLGDSSQTSTTQKLLRPTPFEKKLTEQQKVIVETIKNPFFLPSSLVIDNSNLIAKKSSGASNMWSFSVNTKFGQGYLRGTYGFYEYPKVKAFNPPTDCALPGGSTASSPIPCKAYEKSTEIKAYVNNTQGIPGGITNTEVGSYITMYAERKGMVIMVSTADTSPDELYEIITSMTETEVWGLPENTEVYGADQ